jgi:hypothetical protein
MKEVRLRSSLESAIRSAEEARQDLWARNLDLDFDEIDRAVISQFQQVRRAISRPRDQLGYIVANTDRGGPAASYKPSNISREISRTVYFVGLLGIVEGTLATNQPEPLRVFSVLVGMIFAGFQATRATVGYSDAAVLHKAWRLSTGRAPPSVTAEELLAHRQEIADEYKAPKCSGESEILDAIRNLCGLKAFVEHDGRYLLKEAITFFEDGTIKSSSG